VKAGLARAYILLLFSLVCLILGMTLVVNVSVIVGMLGQNERLSEVLLIASIGAIFAACSMAKERNIWRNEFRSCPRWLQGAVIAVAVYGYIVALAQVFFLEGGNAVLENTVSASAFTLGFDGIAFCVLYSVLFSGTLNDAELIRRARNSVIMMLVVSIFVIVSRNGHLFQNKS
jgi:hypothetical protein